MLWNFKRIIDYIEAVKKSRTITSKSTGNVNYELQFKKIWRTSRLILLPYCLRGTEVEKRKNFLKISFFFCIKWYKILSRKWRNNAEYRINFFSFLNRQLFNVIINEKNGKVKYHCLSFVFSFFVLIVRLYIRYF